MRLLILSCNTGEGHNSAAGAIEEIALSRGGTCEKVDALAFLSKAVSKTVSAIFIKLYRNSAMTKIWKKGYAKLEAENFEEKDGPGFAARLIGTGAMRLRKFLRENDFDGVLCTHPFSAVMLTKALEKQPLDVPCAFLATDYTCAPFVPDQDLEHCCMAHKDLRDTFLACGIREETLRETGIPVKKIFSEKHSRAEARKTLDVPQNALNVVLMCGSMGCGPMEDLAEKLSAALPDNALLTVCCGTNKKLLTHLEKANLKNVRPLGFTHDVPLWMDSADVFITKPGGLSITEAANRGVPLLLINIVGGCEAPNFKLFLEKGYAIGTEDVNEVPTLCTKLLKDDETRAALVRRQNEDFSENAAMKLWRLFDPEA